MENNKPHDLDAINSILEKIKKNELTMRPRTYFTLKLVALVLLVVAICIVSIFLSSFILFTLRASGHASLIGFGLSGWEVFLILFPWKLFLFDIILIILLEWLLRSFRFGYKVPALYLLFGVVVLMTITGIIVDHLRLHDDLMRLAGQHRIPSQFGKIYDQARRPPPPPYGWGILRATVTAINPDNTIQVDFDDPRKATTTSLTVLIQSQSFLNMLSIGDKVFIGGKIVNDHIEAQNLRIALPHSEMK
jgi:hypothetical protein